MSSDLGVKPDSDTQSEDMPKSEKNKDTEIKENVNSEGADTMPDSDLSDKSNTLPEPIRVGKDVPRFPPINMTELASILQGPNMPSQKLMKEVTEKIRMKNDESGSDDRSDTSGGVGIRGILDCILEASLFHQDSEDESDGEGDEIFVRELPCRFCKKIFGSTMNLKTHVLMTHSQEDPSVLNIKNQSWDGSRKEKLSPLGRSRSTEGKDRESSVRSRKRSATGQQEDISSRDKQVRSRHNSKEQSSKISGKIEDKPQESKTAIISSQKITRQISHEKDDAKKCDLKSSVLKPVETETSEQVIHTSPGDTPSSSKATKRKSSKVSSSKPDISSPTKKAKRSQRKSVEANEGSGVQLRRSSRRK